MYCYKKEPSLAQLNVPRKIRVLLRVLSSEVIIWAERSRENRERSFEPLRFSAAAAVGQKVLSPGGLIKRKQFWICESVTWIERQPAHRRTEKTGVLRVQTGKCEESFQQPAASRSQRRDPGDPDE